MANGTKIVTQTAQRRLTVEIDLNGGALITETSFMGDADHHIYLTRQEMAKIAKCISAAYRAREIGRVP